MKKKNLRNELLSFIISDCASVLTNSKSHESDTDVINATFCLWNLSHMLEKGSSLEDFELLLKSTSNMYCVSKNTK